MRRLASVLQGLVALLLAAPAGAQARAATADRADGPLLLSAQPVQILANVFSGDFEFRTSPGATLGLATTWQFGEIDFDQDDYRDPRRWLSVEGKFKWYLSGDAFRGVSLAASAGVLRVRDFEYEPGSVERPVPLTPRLIAVTSPTVGLELGANWMIGRGRRTAFQLGLGLKRATSLDGVQDPVALYPTARVALGYRM